MKIMQLLPSFNIGGVEIMCENLIYELKRMNHEVIAVSLHAFKTPISKRLEESGVKTINLDKKSGFDFSMIPKLKKIFKFEKPDVIHMHGITIRYAVPAAISTGVKNRVCTIHAVASKESIYLSRRLSEVYFKYFNLIPVAISETIKETIIEEYKVKKEKIPIIHNGINLTKCKPKNDYKIGKLFKILHSARFSKEKNHIGMLEAFKIFHSKYPNTALYMLGDGKLRKNIEDYIEINSLNESVKLLGFKDNIFDFLHDSDIITLPSHYEGFPMVLIEAMGTGLPIVAAAVGGIPDMLNENNALLVPVKVEAIADAYEKYYLDEDLRRTHGQAALKESIRFSSKIMAEKYLEVYHSIMKSNQNYF